MDPDIKAATILHFTGGIQQQVTAGGVLNVTYVGAKGDNLVRQTEVNYRIPQLLADGTKFWPANAPVAQPLFGQWVFLFSGA